VVTDENGVSLITNESSTTDGVAQRVYRAPGYGLLLGYVSYPKKDVNGNYYSNEVVGKAGLEASYNTQLAGENGTILVEKDALGNVASQGTIVPPQNGESLTLAIDTRVQDAFYKAISSLADKIPFSGGTGILMDVNTGELRALVSYPEYDSNVLSSGGPSSVIAGYATDSRRPYLDRPVQGLYCIRLALW
jgi:penicillin-binding protein 2